VAVSAFSVSHNLGKTLLRGKTFIVRKNPWLVGKILLGKTHCLFGKNLFVLFRKTHDLIGKNF